MHRALTLVAAAPSATIAAPTPTPIATAVAGIPGAIVVVTPSAAVGAIDMTVTAVPFRCALTSSLGRPHNEQNDKRDSDAREDQNWNAHDAYASGSSFEANLSQRA